MFLNWFCLFVVVIYCILLHENRRLITTSMSLFARKRDFCTLFALAMARFVK